MSRHLAVEHYFYHYWVVVSLSVTFLAAYILEFKQISVVSITSNSFWRFASPNSTGF
jgi:hypothetical protein